MHVPSPGYTKSYFSKLDAYLEKRPKEDESRWRLMTPTWPAWKEHAFDSIEELWLWWADTSAIRLTCVRLIDEISAYYAEADLDERKNLRFYLFDNYYSLRPLPSPKRPWHGRDYTVDNLPRNWKSMMLKYCQEKGMKFYFRPALGDALDAIDVKHPLPLWTERVSRAFPLSTREHGLRPRL